jgi:hypothetical protein
MKTKLLFLLGAAVAVCSLSSCEVFGTPGAYGYGGGYVPSSYYGSSYYSRPLLSYTSVYSRPSYGYNSYSRPYSSFSNFGYNRGSYCAPLVSHYSCSSFNRGFGGSSSFGVGSSFGQQGCSSFGGSSFGGYPFGGGHHHH